jgi:hypothetical protein
MTEMPSYTLLLVALRGFMPHESNHEIQDVTTRDLHLARSLQPLSEAFNDLTNGIILDVPLKLEVSAIDCLDKISRRISGSRI